MTTNCILGKVRRSWILIAFSDSDWTSSVEDRCCPTCYCFTQKETPIWWKWTEQPTVALFTCDAEYIGPLRRKAWHGQQSIHLYKDQWWQSGSHHTEQESSEQAEIQTDQSLEFEGMSATVWHHRVEVMSLTVCDVTVSVQSHELYSVSS